MNEKILGNRSMDFKIRMINKTKHDIFCAFLYHGNVILTHYNRFPKTLSIFFFSHQHLGFGGSNKILWKTCFYGSTKKTKFGCWFCEQLIETELISETDLEMFMSPNM